MPTFKLSDSFSFSTDVEAGPAALSRYFKSLPDWVALGINLKAFAETTWDDPEVAKTENQLSFSSPVNLGGQATALTINAGVNGTLTKFVPETDNDPLFYPDPFGDNIPVRLNERYITVSLEASLTGGLSAPVDNLKFGFNGTSTVNLTYSQRFSLAEVTPPVLECIKHTLASFSIPGDLDDIAAMQEGSVASVDSSGTLKFSAKVNLLSFVNPLASVNVPIGSALKVTAGGSIQVGAGYQYSGDYQIRVQKLAGSTFHLGFYRQRKNDFSITASANAGISTTLDANPLFQALLQTISADPKADQNELLAAGLHQAKVDAIQSALQSAIDRTLSIGVSMEAHDCSETDAMFLYEVDASALTQDTRAVLESALQGDLSGLVDRDHAPGAGIKVLRTLVGSSKTLKHCFKVNLLGIYNEISISSLVTIGTVAWDALTGEYVLTDSVNASRLGIDSVNYGVNSDKLRKVVAESLLMTAAYRAGDFVTGQPLLKASQSYFELNAKAKTGDLWHDLSIGAGLGFDDAAAAAAKLPLEEGEAGRTTVLAEASYDDASFTDLFFKGGQQRTEAEYDRAGRDALKYLARPGGATAYRLRAVQDDALWKRMRDTGNVTSLQFAHLFPDLPAIAVSAIGVDYINIVWWTKAMLGTGEKLRDIRQYLSQPGKLRTDPQFLELKQALADQLKTLTDRTSQDFDGPWGLLAMSLAAPRAGRKFMLSNPAVSLAHETALSAAAAK